MADTLAKQAAQDEDEQNITSNRLPITSAASEIKGGLMKWQTMGRHCEGGAVQIFLPHS
jgi:hypothetical protein